MFFFWDVDAELPLSEKDFSHGNVYFKLQYLVLLSIRYSNLYRVLGKVPLLTVHVFRTRRAAKRLFRFLYLP